MDYIDDFRPLPYFNDNGILTHAVPKSCAHICNVAIIGKETGFKPITKNRLTDKIVPTWGRVTTHYN
jgi:hypothetical protein